MTHPQEPNPKRAVLLLGFGGPRNLDEVPEFLFEILRDPNTLQMPLPQWIQERIARRIVKRRGGIVQEQYAAIGGRSPIVGATEVVAGDLRELLARDDESLAVYVAHRYLPGHTEAAVAAMMADGIEDILAFPLYPHFSYATVGSSIQQLRTLLQQAEFTGNLHGIRSFPDHPDYVAALFARLEQCLARAAADPESTVILCTAHGLPASYVRRGDPYVDELRRTLVCLEQRFPEWKFELSFQSRVGPAEWLKPYTDEIIPVLAKSGVRQVVFLPISFVNDHIETLYEIDVTYFDRARETGMQPFRMDAIENHERFVAMLAEISEAWRRGQAGAAVETMLPPHQDFARYGKWALIVWTLLFVVAVFFAMT